MPTTGLLPREHSVERSQTIAAPPADVFAKIADIPNRAQWRTGLKNVTMEPGGRFFTEVHGMGPLRMELIETTPPTRMITRIADDKLAFGGTWTITVTPTPGGSNVTIREDGFVKSLVFRFISRFIMGHTRTMDQFLKDLAAQYSQPVS